MVLPHAAADGGWEVTLLSLSGLIQDKPSIG